MLEEIVKAVRGLFAEAGASRLPPEIVLNYPKGSPAEGTEAGRYHLRRTETGGFEYQWHATPREIAAEEVVADFVIEHEFDALESFVDFISDNDTQAQVFVSGEPFEPKTVQAYVDRDQPAAGMVSLQCDRHPAWLRWSEIAGTGETKDLTHVELADLLLDNQEDLEEPLLAKVLSQFRAARSVEHVADHDTGSAVGVRVTWKGGAGNADGAKVSDVAVPREFSAQIPAFVGAWKGGAEPAFAARFRLRVIPPRGQEEAPKFRILWVNAREYELIASAAVESAVNKALSQLEVEVFLGSPSATRFVPLKG